jgi:hypothetical protein
MPATPESVSRRERIIDLAAYLALSFVRDRPVAAVTVRA